MAALLFCFPIALEAESLKVVSGTVRYSVGVRTLGVKGHNIVGTNSRCVGAIFARDNGDVDGGLIVPVSGFESDNSRRDRDVAKILDYKNHPAIVFEIVEMTQAAIKHALDRQKGKVAIKVKISAAGASATYDTVVEFDWVAENRVRCTTTIEAKFSDFGIKPPTLGLVFKRAPDAITLSGDVLFEREKGK